MQGFVRFGRMTAIVSSALVGLALAASPVTAQPKPAEKKSVAVEATTPPAPPPAPAPAATAPATDATAKVTGFRSAKFGMTEAEVQAAIAKDFPAAGAPKELGNPSERTKVLLVKAADVLPDGGTAEISYILGYKSKTLIQVNLVWAKSTDSALTPEMLVADGEALRSYFVGEGFPAASIITNVAAPDGVILFRGTDSDGHQVLLEVKGTATGTGAGPKTFTAQATTLFYVLTPTNPDVFKVPAGKF